MEVTKDKHLNHCDDCGHTYTDGFIIKGKYNQIRLHLCQSCFKKLLSGQVTVGRGLKRSSSKLIIDYPDVKIFVTNNKGQAINILNIVTNFEEYRKSHGITATGLSAERVAIDALIYGSKACGQELAKVLNRSKIGYTNWIVFKETDSEIVLECKSPEEGKLYLHIIFDFKVHTI